MANFADLVRANRSQGKGVLGSLGGALGKSTLEKVDPRNYLFNRSGVLTALFPSLKGYQAKATTEKISSTTTSGGGFSSGQAELISDKLDQISVQNSIVAKNSMVLPMMHRDINVMRQSMIKMVKIWGGNQRDKADRFFMDSKTREAAYENRFSKKPTPEKQTTKEEGEGFFSKLLGSGMMPLLARGGLALLVGGAIKKYFDDPEFKKLVDDGVSKIFNTILEVMKEHWGITLGALALIFPNATLSLIGSGLKLLASVLTGGAAEIGVIGAMRSLIGILMGPAGVVAALGLLAWKITDWASSADINNPGSNPIANVGAAGKEFADWANEKSGYNDEIKKRQENIRKGLHADGTPYGPEERTSSGPTMEKSIQHYEKLLASAKTDTERNSIQKALDALYAMPGAPERKTPATTPTQAPAPKTEQKTAPTPEPKQTSGSNSGSADSNGLTWNSLSKQQQDALLMNQAVAEGWNKSTSIQHSHNNPGNITAPGGVVAEPQRKFGGVPGGTYNGLTFVKFPTMEAGWDAMRDLWSRKYGNMPIGSALEKWANADKTGGNQSSYNQVALNGLAGPNGKGGTLNQSSTQLAANHRGEGNTNIQNVGNTYNVANQGGGEQPQVQLSSAEVMDTSLMRELFRKRAVSYT